MSAFMITTETMQRVVDAIDKRSRGAFCGMPTYDSACLDAIGAALFAMNAAALNDRYPGTAIAVPQFSYRPLGTARTTEHYHALACFLYQCSEGNVPETELFQAVEKLSNALACEIAGEMARKEGVPWDWEEA